MRNDRGLHCVLRVGLVRESGYSCRFGIAGGIGCWASKSGRERLGKEISTRVALGLFAGVTNWCLGAAALIALLCNLLLCLVFSSEDRAEHVSRDDVE